MFQVERLQKIQQILTAKKSVSVIELSDILDVSEITIRRDFEKLEKDGFLQRTHGGAVLNPDHQFAERQLDTQPIRSITVPPVPPLNAALGRLCVDIVEDYDVLFLSRTPSNIAMVRHLQEKVEVNVVTNSLEIMLAMAQQNNNRIILTGGRVDLDRWSMDLGGNSSMENLRFNKAFVHVQGLDFAGGVTVNDHSDLLLYQMLKRCTTGDIVVVVEGIVFGKTGLFKVDDLENVTAVVTDSKMPDEYKSWLYQKGVKLYQKFDL